MASKEDFDELLHAAVDVASGLLGEHNEFSPFAMAMATDGGEIFLVEPDEEDAHSHDHSHEGEHTHEGEHAHEHTHEGEHAHSHDDVDDEQVVKSLHAGLREAALAGRWRAVAVVADVTLEDEEGGAVTAAIHVMLEHVADEPVHCAIPYSFEGEEIVLDELMAEAGEPHVFADVVKN